MQGKAIAGVVIGILVVAAIVLPLVLILPDSGPEPQLESVTTEATQGNLIGSINDVGAMFLGVPFSQPPIGEYRYLKPRPAVPFPEGTWDATYTRPACIQICNQPAEEYSCPQGEDSEDCLYLNVFIPKRAIVKTDGDDILEGEHYVIDEKLKNGDDDGLAVMVWFYGGAFTNGAGSVTIYDSRYIADAGDIIGVTMNYRVGPLGFLVQGMDDDAALGNQGIWDQIRCLEWVKENIRFFGGNPNKVTVYGQSAGSESVGVLMTSPYVEEGLFHQGIMESNPFGLPFRDYDNAKEYGSRFAMSAGCLRDDMDCLREIDTDTILRAFKDSKYAVVGLDKLTLLFQPWGPCIDGDFLPQQPVDAFMEDKAMDIPSIVGSTLDEGMLFIALAWPEPMSIPFYRGLIRSVFKRDSQKVLNQYPPLTGCPGLPNPPFGNCDQRLQVNQVATDFMFQCPQRSIMKMQDMSTQFFYIFTHIWSFSYLWEIPMCETHVCHGSEIPYVFNMENLTIYEFTESERDFSKRMQWYWSNFAKFGTPNAPSSSRDALTEDDVPGAKYWRPFDDGTNGETDYALNLAGHEEYEMEDPYKEQCVFWDELDSYADHRTADYRRRLGDLLFRNL